MCLAIPMKVIDKNGIQGQVENAGLRLSIILSLTPDARIGDYVLVHAGYSLSVIDETEAAQTIAMLKQLGMMGE